MIKINFRKLNDSENDYKLLYNWCQKEYIYKYFEQRKLSYQEIVNKYKKRIRKNAKVKTFIINYNNKDIGLIQYSKVDIKDIKRFNLESYGNCYQVDLFIGEEDYLYKGNGKQIVEEFIVFINENNIDTIVAFVEEENIISLKCLKKLNFTLIKTFKQDNGIKEKTNYCLLVKKVENKND